MARKWTIDFSEEALADQIAKAKETAIAEEKAGPCARQVEYDHQRNFISLMVHSLPYRQI